MCVALSERGRFPLFYIYISNVLVLGKVVKHAKSQISQTVLSHVTGVR